MGSETRRYVKTRQLIDYHNFVSGLEQSHIYCISDGVMSAIRQLLRERGLWRTSYVTDFADGVYYIPDLAEFDVIDTAISEFLNEGATMATCAELSEILEGLTNVLSSGINNNCCADGSGGASPDTPPVGFEDDGEVPPDGFPDYPTYNQYKCDAASYVVSGWAQDINWMKTADFVALGASGLAVGLLTPGVNVVVIIGLVLFWISVGLFAAALDNVEDWLVDNDDLLRCLLYNATNATDARADVMAEVASSALGDVEKTILDYFVTYASINQIFTAANVPEIGSDCSDCDPCPGVNVVLGVFDDVDEFTSVLHPTIATHIVSYFYNHDGLDYCGPAVTVNSITVNYGSPAFGLSANAYRLFDQAGTLVYNANVPPPSPVANVGQVVIRDSDATPAEFNITVDWS